MQEARKQTPQRADKPAMEVRNLSFSYGKNKVLKDVSLKIEEGQVTTLMGANGCGKSTLFNLMTKNLTPGKGNIFRAESVAQDVFDAIDDVAEKLLKQMSKYKKKLIKKNQGKESVRFENIPEVPEAEEEETKIARTKKFTLTPMTAEEAILQMELLQHNFFVYLDAESGNVNVVYKRNDEDYGLLETEH